MKTDLAMMPADLAAAVVVQCPRTCSWRAAFAALSMAWHRFDDALLTCYVIALL